MGAANSAQRGPELFAELADSLVTCNERCQEQFAELDRSGSGVLDRRELTSMVLRMLPDVRRAEVRYFRAMLDAGDVAGGVAFDAFVALVRECAAAAAATRDGGARWEGIAATLRQCMDHDEARMVQACEEFDIDHRGVIDHEDVARLVRRVDPGVSTADLRFILALLFRADMDDQGSLHIPTLLKALGFLGGSPLSAVPPPPQSGAPTSHEVNAGNDMQLELSTTDDAPELPVEPVPARSSWTPPPPPPPPAPEVQKRTQTKEELRREVEVHRVVETQLHGACKVAQEAMAVDADELRREQRKLEEFWGALQVLSAGVSAAALRTEEELRAGFARVRQLTDARESALLAQVADVAAERLATCHEQQDASTATVADAATVLAVAAAAERETDAYRVLQLTERFDSEYEALRQTGRLSALEAKTNTDFGLVIDFAGCLNDMDATLRFDEAARERAARVARGEPADPKAAAAAAEAARKDVLLEQATREAERLTALLDRAASFTQQQKDMHDQAMLRLEREKAALVAEHEARYEALQRDTEERQADFERRLMVALDRSEAALSSKSSGGHHIAKGKGRGGEPDGPTGPPLYPAFVNTVKSRPESARYRNPRPFIAGSYQSGRP